MGSLGYMITKIKKIKNAGIFGDYSWDANLPEFKRYNLIYGWNWSGKTTLSSIFSAFEKGSSEKYPLIEYEVETQRGSFGHTQPYSNKVRVFNQDYVTKNVPVLSGKAKHIFIIGEENKKLAEEIEADEKLLLEKEAKLKNSRTDKSNQERQKDKYFTDIARTISSNISGETTRNYRKPNAEAAFRQLTNKELLDEPDINQHNLTLRQLELPPVKELNIPRLKYCDEELELSNILAKINADAATMADQTVESITIDRLKQNEDISKWVEEGIGLHAKHNSTLCEYCNQSLPEQRIKDLANHFSEADKRLKDNINVLIEELKNASSLIEGIHAPDKANLYKEIQVEYQSAAQDFDNVKKTVLENIVTLLQLLEEKKLKTTECVNLHVVIDTKSFIDAVEKVNTLVRKHNTKTENFKNEKDTAQEKLEMHYLSTIYDDVKGIETIIRNYEAEIKTLDDGDPNKPNAMGIKHLKKKIADNRAAISSTHIACEDINRGLEGFLGRKEIVFEVQDEGYIIKRNGVIANDLSEGEKTAITFVYFTVHLRDQEFNIEDGVIVVDDPVSSFDSNSLYQAFAFLKNAVKDAKQIFILTHNFDFLRLLLYWTKDISRRGRDIGYYMIKNKYINDMRQAYIDLMDKELKDYESEYHYLFKILYTFQSDGSIVQSYPIPNIARKTLETFLMFRVPNSESLYKKMEVMKEYYDENKVTAIYKFTNDLSHLTGKGFDPALVLETQNNVKYLLEMMEAVFPEHYRILVESVAN